MLYDVAIIGGGVIGGLILREATKQSLSAVLIERESDVSMGQSKANSGIVHGGFDAKEGTLKARFNVSGNAMMRPLAEELGVKYKNIGSLVVAFSAEDMETLQVLKARGEKNGVKDLEIIDAKTLFDLEPNVSDKAVGALYAKSGGIVCPYELTIAAIGNAMDNGAVLERNFSVSAIDGSFGDFSVRAEDGRVVRAKVVVNAAGLGAQKIAELVGDFSFKIGARRGEYVLLDRESGDLASHTLFFTPTKKGKGVLITPTVDGNIIIGPTAEEVPDGSTATTVSGLNEVVTKAGKMCKNIPFYNTITSFAGVRAYSDRHDFIIENSPAVKGFINCAGIESPGLTSAPAIAEYVVNELIGGLLTLKSNDGFDPKRIPDGFFKDLSTEDKNALIKREPSYGHIVCRCEQVTEGEILRALRVNPKASDIDGVKRRTRAGMGRCQGGFCMPLVAELIAKETGLPLEEVTKCGAGSEILEGKSK